MVANKEWITGTLYRELRSGVPSFVLLDDEVLFTHHYEFKYRSGVAFKKDFDRKTTQLLEGGFVARWFANNLYGDGVKIKRTAEEIGPQVLTMDHLAIGFIVWLIPLTFSLIVFAYEIGKRPCRDFIGHIRDAIVARSVVHAFMKTSPKAHRSELSLTGVGTKSDVAKN